MKIAFIACFYKTIFFKKIADELQKQGQTSYWISTSIKWYNWLIEQGIEKEHILLLRKDQVDGRIHNDAYISDVENITNANLKNLYFMDRVISKWDWNIAYNYMKYVINNVGLFIKNNEIEVVFGEATAFHEVATAVICQYYGKLFLAPHTIRIPSDRFCFFYGYSQESYFCIKSNQSRKDNQLKAREAIDAVITKGEKPNYWYLNNVRPRYSLDVLKKMLSKFQECIQESKHDASIKSLKHHVVYEKKYLRPINYFLSMKMGWFNKPKIDEKFVLFTLHKQPEASIDVLGARYSNQIEVVKEIARVLPHDVVLYVKEHSNCLGERPVSYLRQIAMVPGVKLIDPFSDTHKLIRHAELVITVSGTVAYEAGLFGKKAVTLAPMFFNSLPCVDHIKSISAIPSYLLKTNKPICPEENVDVVSEFIEASFPGIISDPDSIPECISNQNVIDVANAFMQVITFLEQVQTDRGGL